MDKKKKLAMFMAVAGAKAQGSPIPTDGLIGQWLLDNGSMLDSSGNGYNGSLNGTLVNANGINNVANTAIDFANGCISLPAITTTDWTASLWIYERTDGYYTMPFTFQNSGGGCGICGTGFGNYFTLKNGSYVSTSNRSTPKILNQWHHVLATSDGKIYSQGSLGAGSTGEGGFGWRGIGAKYYGLFSDCIIDNVRLYNRILNSTEITQLYQEKTV